MSAKLSEVEYRDLLNKILVLRSFMSAPVRRKLKKSCTRHDIRHFLSRKDLPDLVERYKHTDMILLRDPDEYSNLCVLHESDVRQVLKNCRTLLKHDVDRN